MYQSWIFVKAIYQARIFVKVTYQSGVFVKTPYQAGMLVKTTYQTGFWCGLCFCPFVLFLFGLYFINRFLQSSRPLRANDVSALALLSLFTLLAHSEGELYI